MKNYYKYICFIIYVLILAQNFLCASSDNKKSFPEPDYDKWEQVKEGMTITEVEKLIGKPSESKESIQYKGNVKIGIFIEVKALVTTYGNVHSKILSYSDRNSPGVFQYTIFYKDGKVDYKRSPFEREKAPEGRKISTPKMMYPYNNAIFTHYPYIIDFRWFKASGKEPIQYKIQFDFYSTSQKKWEYFNGIADTTHYAAILGSYGKYRWRIQAMTKLEKSAWSEYQYFEFRKLINTVSAPNGFSPNR